MGLLVTQVTISEVSAEREGGRIAITVKGDAMIDPEAASATLGEGRLYLYVRDARVREANRAWDNDVAEGAEEIRAHRHRLRVELAIPLGDGACQGPVEFEKSPGGLRALVACDGGSRPSVARAKEPAMLKPAPRADAVARTVVPAALSASDAAALKAKLALGPDENAGDDLPAQATGPKKTAGAPMAGSNPKPIAPPAKEVASDLRFGPPSPAQVAPQSPVVGGAGVGVSVGVGVIDPKLNPLVPAAAALPRTPTAMPNNPPASSSAGGGRVVLAGLAFLAVAIAAFFFSRRRRTVTRHIEILETASLGPKRALVVARVGRTRLILGSSEAGITLLQELPDTSELKVESLAARIIESMPAAEDAAWDAMVTATLTSPAGAPAVTASPPAPTPTPWPDLVSAPPLAVAPPPASRAVPVAMTFEPTMKIEVEEAPNPTSAISLDPGEPHPVGQAGLLARLFRKGTPANDGRVSLPRFQDYLEDSFEDQELRRKLALGLSGRVR
ncbi:MAG TPA: flagellar biosynthetic protein FliO [Polyangia bacterium]|nr:flagellar biosynthetic protein FliO [Polyangia bacterium]